MNRREALQRMAAVGLTMLPSRAQAATRIHTGWVNSPAARRQFIKAHRHPFLSQQAQHIHGTSDGRIVMLHPFMEMATGHPLVPHGQDTGDCTSHAFGLGVDILTSTQIHMAKRPELWIAECATEPLYGGGRVEIAGNVLGHNMGCAGHWIAEWLIRYGALLRQEYPGYDFTTYSGAMADRLGIEGCPDALEPLAKLHPVKTISLVRSFEEACDAIANGYPVTLCSSVGFGMTSRYWVRDSQGFLRRRGRWGHAMLGIGFDRKSRRQGICIENSWNDWVSGPTQHGQPRGSFWCDASTVNSILSEGDCHALSGYVGYPRIDIPDYDLY